MNLLILLKVMGTNTDMEDGLSLPVLRLISHHLLPLHKLYGSYGMTSHGNVQGQGSVWTLELYSRCTQSTAPTPSTGALNVIHQVQTTGCASTPTHVATSGMTYIRLACCTKKIKGLTYIAIANFVFPVIFSLILIVIVYCEINPVAVNNIILVNTSVAVIGVVFATVWAGFTHWDEERLRMVGTLTPYTSGGMPAKPELSAMVFQNNWLTMMHVTISASNIWASIGGGERIKFIKQVICFILLICHGYFFWSV
jgi:hypothetical protein